jgi:putative transposase
MYSKEKREKAIKLYIKYNKCASDVIHELGCPDRSTLVKRYKTFKETRALWEQFKGRRNIHWNRKERR